VTSVKTHRVTIANRDGRVLDVREDETIYDVCERENISAPIACRYGGCITCAARMLSGKVRQPKGTALNKRQSQAGYILLCVAHPKEDCTIEIGVEIQNDLYRNPFMTASGRR